MPRGRQVKVRASAPGPPLRIRELIVSRLTTADDQTLQLQHKHTRLLTFGPAPRATSTDPRREGRQLLRETTDNQTRVRQSARRPSLPVRPPRGPGADPDLSRALEAFQPGVSSFSTPERPRPCRNKSMDRTSFSNSGDWFKQAARWTSTQTHLRRRRTAAGAGQTKNCRATGPNPQSPSRPTRASRPKLKPSAGRHPGLRPRRHDSARNLLRDPRPRLHPVPPATAPTSSSGPELF